MAHAAKYAASASGHLTKHYERAKDDKGEYIKFGNQDIDPSRTPLNYNLAPERDGGQVEFMRQRMSEVRCMKRDDVKVMCSWVVTMPKYSWHDKSVHVHHNREQIERLFFERCYKFMEKRYGGAQNVISAFVHKDEVTPHIHFAFIPVVKDKKRRGEKVSAKEVLTRDDLATFHVDLERYLDSFKDWHFEVINEATKDGNKEIAQLKIESAHAEVVEAQKEAQKEREKVNTLQDTKKALEGEISALQTVKEELTSAEVEALKFSKTITGGVKGMTHKEATLLKATAITVDEEKAARAVAERRADEAEQRAAAAEQRADRVIASANAQLREKSAALDERRRELEAKYEKPDGTQYTKAEWKERIALARLEEQPQKEYKNLEKKYNRLEKAVNYLLGVIKERLPSFYAAISAKTQRIMDGKDDHTLNKG